ncbi:NET domain containing protein [Trema orientale]|uniref:NET domain containing protein n=1 Tax=Trema orientale TaxID=63057 RepID=A0A2P5BCE6_TREOI|nr:NET domain containing protein [Trema orientale]
MVAMSEETKGSGEHNRDGPDYFGYYTRQVDGLLSNDEDFLLFGSRTSESSGKGSGDVRRENGTENGCEASRSFFGDGLGAGLSDFKRERLKALLLQGVNVLTPEVDEMLYPVVRTRGIQMHRSNRKRILSGAASKDDVSQSPQKKLKITPVSPSMSPPQLASSTDPGSNVAKKISSCCHDKETVDGNSEEPKEEESNFYSNSGIEKESREVNDDDHRQFLLENDSPEVDEILKNVSDELSAKLGHMDQQLEELLDIVMSKYRPMTLPEKKQLQKMIKELPPKNLDRVAELVERGKRGKPAEKRSHDEIFIDLEKESNVTLWRLYYYVQAVEKARKLSR